MFDSVGGIMNDIVVILKSDETTHSEVLEIVGLLITKAKIKDVRVITLEPHEFGYMIKAIETDLREN